MGCASGDERWPCARHFETTRSGVGLCPVDRLLGHRAGTTSRSSRGDDDPVIARRRQAPGHRAATICRSADPGSHERSEQEGDARRRAAEDRLAQTAVQPVAAGDLGDDGPAGERGRSRTRSAREAACPRRAGTETPGPAHRWRRTRTTNQRRASATADSSGYARLLAGMDVDRLVDVGVDLFGDLTRQRGLDALVDVHDRPARPLRRRCCR